MVEVLVVLEEELNEGDDEDVGDVDDAGDVGEVGDVGETGVVMAGVGVGDLLDTIGRR